MVQPFIVKRALYANQIVEEYEPKIIQEKICSEKTLETMRILMEGVVENGTATNIKTDLYKIAGKTGTAEKVENKVYTEKHYTSFVGYFPAEAPKYSCIVVIDNPKTAKQYGALVSAPVFREVADFLMKSYISVPFVKNENTAQKSALIRSGYQPDLKVISEELGLDDKNQYANTEEWVLGRLKNDTLRLVPHKVTVGVVPNVIGMTLKDALFILENRGLKVVFYGKGKVRHQSLETGMRITKGNKIILTLS
jgi:cell division protein FtsI (penicillin-binding protein 3)